MKKTITIQLFACLCLLGTSFSSCDMVNEITTGTVSIRLENASTMDLEDVSTLGMHIEALKAGDQTEYFEVEHVFLDEDGEASYYLSSNISGTRFDNIPKHKCELCGTGGYYEDMETLKRGKYTISIDLSKAYDDEGNNSSLYLKTTIDKD